MDDALTSDYLDKVLGKSLFGKRLLVWDIWPMILWTFKNNSVSSTFTFTYLISSTYLPTYLFIFTYSVSISILLFIIRFTIFTLIWYIFLTKFYLKII
jgi:hypothetical protein